MRKSFSKLKNLLRQEFRIQGFGLKYIKLTRKKWYFLKTIKNSSSFFNPILLGSPHFKVSVKTFFKKNITTLCFQAYYKRLAL